jgi:MFS family permease
MNFGSLFLVVAVSFWPALFCWAWLADRFGRRKRAGLKSAGVVVLSIVAVALSVGVTTAEHGSSSSETRHPAAHTHNSSTEHTTIAPSYQASTPTAICMDGTESYSATHSGTCSWHGGVDQWLDG